MLGDRSSEVTATEGGSQVRSVHEEQTVEFQLDPVSKKFVKDKKVSKDKERVPEFVVKPRRQFVNEGQAAKFKCSFEGSPHTTLSWSKDGVPLSSSQKYKIYKEGDLHWLEVCDVTSEDAGCYTCVAQNSAGSCKENAELDVYVKPKTGTKKSGFVAPKVDIPLSDLHVAPGDRNVTLECKFSNAIDASASWYKDGRLLTSGFLSKQSFDGRLARLVISRVATKDSGSYECAVSNTGGEAKTKASLTVIVAGTRSIPPKFVNPLSNLTLKEGEKLVLEAKVTGYPKPSINWYKDGQVIKSSKTVTTEFDGSTVCLVIAKVTMADGAVYKCIAENEAGKDQIKSTLTVKGSSDASTDDFREPPKFVRELHDIEVDDGDTVELAVEVKGMLPMRVIWLHNKKEVQANDPVFTLMSHGDTHTLTIPKCLPEDAGIFVCEVYNDVGDCETCCRLCVRELDQDQQEEMDNNKSKINQQIDEVEHSFKLINVDPVHHQRDDNLDLIGNDSPVLNNASNGGDCLRQPEFVLMPRIAQVEEGKCAIFLCRGTGNPPPTVQWSRQGEIIKNKGRYKISTGDDSVLEVKAVTLSDAGKYTCTLINQAGSVSTDTSLNVTPRKAAQTDFRSVLRASSPHHVTTTDSHSDKALKDKTEICDFKKVLTTKQDKTTKTTFSPELKDFRDVLKHKSATESGSVLENNVKHKVSQKLVSENIINRGESPKLASENMKSGFNRKLESSPKLEIAKSPKLESDRRTSKPDNQDFRNVLRKPGATDKGSEQGVKLRTHGQKNDVETSTDFRSVLKKTGNKARINNSAYSGQSVNPSVLASKQNVINQTDFRHVLHTRRQGESGKPFDSVTADNHQQPIKPKFTSEPPIKPKFKSEPPIKSKFTSFVKEPVRPESIRMKDSEPPIKSVFTKGVRESNLNSPIRKDFSSEDRYTKSSDTMKNNKDSLDLNSNNVTSKLQEKRLPEFSPKSNRAEKIERMLDKLDETTNEILAMGSNPTSVTEVNRNSLSPQSHSARQIWIEDPKVTMETNIAVGNKPDDSQKEKTSEISNVLSLDIAIETPVPRQSDTAQCVLKASAIVTNNRFADDDSVPDLSENNRVPNYKSINSSSSSNHSSMDENKDRIPRSLLRRNSQEKPPVLSRSVDKRPRQHPVFKSKLTNQTVSEGSCVTLECKVLGIPRPEIAWFMNSKQIKPSKFFRMTYEEDVASLVIEGAYPEDDGDYMCTASNVVGIETQTCHLFVTESGGTSTDQTGDELEEDEESIESLYDAPEIHDISPTSLSIMRGKKTEIQASFTAETNDHVIWLKDRAQIPLGNRFCVNTTDDTSCLTIYNIEIEDSGTYSLLVETALGEDSRSMTISVEDVPDKPVGQPYASEVTLRSVILSWCGPAYDGGSPVTNYKIEICDAAEKEWKSLSDKCFSTSYQVADLSPHTPYFFRVSAENKHGIGQPSETSEVVVTKDQRPSMRLSVESDEEEDLPAPFSPRIVSVRKDENFDDLYMLKGELGKGKFGSVYQCEEKCNGATWAAKIIKCRGKDKMNIHSEIEIMNELTHPKLLMLRDAFETARSVTLVMEYIGGGELFERVVNEDFELTERDCVHFLRQICEGVQYMHSKHIIHLDLKPENILCVRKESNLIKIIDFGLARFHKPGESLRAMVGTPEFVAPEVVNFEEIGFPTDIWSLGVICYVLLSGLSPFMGDCESETLANVTRGDFDFDDDAFLEISDNAKDFIQCALRKNPRKRIAIQDCLSHKWLEKVEKSSSRKLRQSLHNLKQFIARRKWQKMGTAIRAIGRMSSLQKLYKHGEGSRIDKASLSSNSETASQSELSPLELKSPEKVEDQQQESKSSSGIEDDRGQSSTSSSTVEDRSQTNQTTDVRTTNNNVFKKPIPDQKFKDKTSCNTETTTMQIQENSLTSLSSITSTNSEEGSPQFLQEMVDCEAFTGDVIRFDVQVDGDPEPSIEWFREERIIAADSRHTITCGDEGYHSLIIRNVTEDDDAEYSCRASNRLGEMTCTADLIICGTGAF